MSSWRSAGPGKKRPSERELSSKIQSIRRVSRAAIVALAPDHDADLLLRVLDAGVDGLATIRELRGETLRNAIVSAMHGSRAIRKLEVELECAVYMTKVCG